MTMSANYGGYEYSFVDKELAEKFVCSICTRVLRDPHLTGCCGQHVCETCLNHWFAVQDKRNCPYCRAEEKNSEFTHILNKHFRREINSLKIHCTNKEKGCQWTGELGSLERHMESANGCDYVEVMCPNKCKKMVQRKFLQYHLKNSCSFRPYRCEHCGHKDTYFIITNSHYSRCLEFPLKCRNYQCDMTGIKRKDMKDHYRLCLEREVECLYKCMAKGTEITKVKRKNLRKHITEQCEKRPYQCKHCGRKDYFRAIIIHHLTCPEFLLGCPNKCGVKDIKRRDMMNHCSQCPEEPVQCLFEQTGCKQKLVRRELEQHLSTTQQQHLMMAMGAYKETKKANQELMQAIEEMKQAHKEKQQRLESLVGANEATKKANEELKKTNQAMKETIEEMKQANQVMERDNLEMDRKLHQVAEELSRSTDELSKTKTNYQIIEAKLKRLESICETNEDQKKSEDQNENEDQSYNIDWY